MSGRTRHLRDGVWVTNRKTDRRQSPRRPPLERLHELNERQARQWPSHWTVRMGFLLPRSLQGFVASGSHGIGVEVFKDFFVQVGHASADQCLDRAQEFFATTARDRPAFTVTASIVSIAHPGRRYGRHLTVVRGAIVVSTGVTEPKVYERAA